MSEGTLAREWPVNPRQRRLPVLSTDLARSVKRAKAQAAQAIRDSEVSGEDAALQRG